MFVLFFTKYKSANNTETRMALCSYIIIYNVILSQYPWEQQYEVQYVIECCEVIDWAGRGAVPVQG